VLGELYEYQNFPDLSQLGDTVVEKINFFKLSGENRAANE
jgi:hypothetical protein